MQLKELFNEWPAQTGDHVAPNESTLREEPPVFPTGRDPDEGDVIVVNGEGEILQAEDDGYDNEVDQVNFPNFRNFVLSIVDVKKQWRETVGRQMLVLLVTRRHVRRGVSAQTQQLNTTGVRSSESKALVCEPKSPHTFANDCFFLMFVALPETLQNHGAKQASFSARKIVNDAGNLSEKRYLSFSAVGSLVQTECFKPWCESMSNIKPAQFFTLAEFKANIQSLKPNILRIIIHTTYFNLPNVKICQLHLYSETHVHTHPPQLFSYCVRCNLQAQ